MHYATLQIMHYANWHYNAILKMHFASAIENAFPSSRNAFYKNGSVSVVAQTPHLFFLESHTCQERQTHPM